MSRFDAESSPDTWIEDRWQRLRRLLAEADYHGHDPFDILNSPFLGWLPQHAPIPLLVNKIGSRLAPDFTRRWLRVAPIQDPKIYACAYFGYRFHGSDQDRETAASMIRRLVGLARPHGKERAFWGYDYLWPTRYDGTNPRAASTLVPGSFALLTLIHHGLDTGSRAHEDLMRRAFSFYVEHHLKQRADGGVFLGYFTHSKVNTHNANLLACAALSLGGRLFGETHWQKVAAAATETSLRAVQDNGFLAYNDHPRGNWTDSFHHLYVIAALRTVVKFNSLAHRERIESALHRLYEYYRHAFMRDDGLINYYPGRLYPIDSHNFAAAALFAQILDDGRLGGVLEACDLLKKADAQTFNEGRGRYAHRRGRWRTDSRLFLRWNQAWMFAALGVLSDGATIKSHFHALGKKVKDRARQGHDMSMK